MKKQGLLMVLFMLVAVTAWAKGKVVVCNCDFDKLSESPEGRVFIKSIVDYVRN